MDLEKARKDKELIIEEAKLKSVAIREEVLKEAKERYDSTIDELYSSKTPEEIEIMKKSEKNILALKEKELENLDKTADIIIKDFVRYIDAKSEEDE
ncbi:MAG: hypothetical protein JW825_00335 [Candidatus Methanofastidiosa archaeon]|nr:hypothetical protein [Candidatus Methanofastidiosa archaeon]